MHGIVNYIQLAAFSIPDYIYKEQVIGNTCQVAELATPSNPQASFFKFLLIQSLL
jgi:hypothetical protein